MVILSVFQPFLDTLFSASASNQGPVTTRLRDLFQQSPLLRDTREKVVDTSKVICALRVAVTEHMDQKGPAFQLAH